MLHHVQPATQSLQLNKHDHQNTGNIQYKLTHYHANREARQEMSHEAHSHLAYGCKHMIKLTRRSNSVKWLLIITTVRTSWNMKQYEQRFSETYVTGRQQLNTFWEEKNNSTGYLRDGIQNKRKQTDIKLIELKNPMERERLNGLFWCVYLFGNYLFWFGQVTCCLSSC